MKKLLSFALAFLMLAALVPARAWASDFSEANQTTKTIYFEDGSSLEMTTEEELQTAGILGLTATQTKSGYRYYTYRNSAGAVAWQAILSGSFTYDGTSSTCTSADLSITISENNFYVVSQSSSKSGNTAYGSFTIGHKVLGVTVNTSDYNMSLSCDKDGNLSGT